MRVLSRFIRQLVESGAALVCALFLFVAGAQAQQHTLDSILQNRAEGLKQSKQLIAPEWIETAAYQVTLDLCQMTKQKSGLQAPFGIKGTSYALWSGLKAPFHEGDNSGIQIRSNLAKFLPMTTGYWRALKACDPEHPVQRHNSISMALIWSDGLMSAVPMLVIGSAVGIGLNNFSKRFTCHQYLGSSARFIQRHKKLSFIASNVGVSTLMMSLLGDDPPMIVPEMAPNASAEKDETPKELEKWVLWKGKIYEFYTLVGVLKTLKESGLPANSPAIVRTVQTLDNDLEHFKQSLATLQQIRSDSANDPDLVEMIDGIVKLCES